MMIPCPVKIKADLNAAAAAAIVANWHFMAAGVDGFAYGQCKAESAAKAVENLLGLLCVNKKSKIKKFKYNLYLVHPDTYLQGLLAWSPDGCIFIHLGEFQGEVRST